MQLATPARFAFVSLLAGGAGACASVLGADFDHAAASDGGADASSESATDACIGDEAACASAREVVVLFGGENAAGALEDTWIWDGRTWTKSSAQAPAGIAGQVMATFGRRVILVGGPTASSWEWNGSGWVPLSVSGLTGTGPMAALGDTLFLMHGNATDAGFDDVTWSWNGADTAWIKHTPRMPPRRSGPIASNGDTMLLQGGNALPNSETILDDTWRWDGASWTQVASGLARADHAMAPLGDTIVLFGGWGNEPGLQHSETFAWTNGGWREMQAAGPPARAGHAMARINGKIVLFGGADGAQTYFGDTWEWDGAQWTKRDVQGPGARMHHAMATFTR